MKKYLLRLCLSYRFGIIYKWKIKSSETFFKICSILYLVSARTWAAEKNTAKVAATKVGCANMSASSGFSPAAPTTKPARLAAMRPAQQACRIRQGQNVMMTDTMVTTVACTASDSGMPVLQWSIVSPTHEDVQTPHLPLRTFCALTLHRP